LPAASLGFVFVFREGIETVLFTLPLIFSDPGGTLAGLILAYLIYFRQSKNEFKEFKEILSCN